MSRGLVGLRQHTPNVAILMATLNGEKYLHEQLDSLARQDYTTWTVHISDDGSEDRTNSIMRHHRINHRMQTSSGPRKGHARNFLTMLGHVKDGDYAAFCDQDDVWMPNKLSRAVDALRQQSGPAIYTANRLISDENLHIRRVQSRTGSTFARLLLRNACAGHTCVLNADAVRHLKTMRPTVSVAFHDWWTALAVTGIGGTYIHDPVPVLHYRQHSHNVLGASGQRLSLLLNGTYKQWFWSNIAALNEHKSRLTPDAQKIVRTLTNLQAAHGLYRFAGLGTHLTPTSQALAVAALTRL